MPKYLYPNYERGDRYLHQLCKRAHRLTHHWRTTRELYSPGIKLTFGYLGNIARYVKRGKELGLLNNILIADHAFAPEQLKNQVYRLGVHNERIRGLTINHKRALSASARNQIYSHLLSLQAHSEFRLMGNYQKFKSNQHSTALVIQPAPVLIGLQTRKFIDWPAESSVFRSKANSEGHQIFESYKRLEIGIDQNGERSKTINDGQTFKIPTKQIISAYCPTSMMALNLILQGIPVTLSAIHPFADQLGLKIATNSKTEAINLVYELAIKTTIECKYMKRLEGEMDKFSLHDCTGYNGLQLSNSKID